MKHSNVIVHPVIIICPLSKFCLSKIAKNLAKFFGHFNKKKILQIDSKWSETRKKHETADPSAAAGADRRQPIFRVEYVNTPHRIFLQIDAIFVLKNDILRKF